MKKLYYINAKNTLRRKLEHQKEALMNFCDKYDIHFANLRMQTKNQVAERIVCYQKISHRESLRRNRNILAIVKRLLTEYQKGRETERTFRRYEKKTYESFVGLEIIGEKIILVSDIYTLFHCFLGRYLLRHLSIIYCR